MELMYACDVRLRIGDFDRNERLQPMAVLDLFQEAATVQADEMGIGRDAMMEQGVFWAVIRLKYEMLSWPGLHDTVRVRTWPHSPSKFSFLRDYDMRAADGELLARGTSEWVLVNFEERKFASVSDHYAGPVDFSEERAFDAKPKKLKDFDAQGARCLAVVPRYSDIDMNRHVNNARYASYVLDALDPDDGADLRMFQMDFRHEVLPDEELSVYVQDTQGEVLAKGVDAQGVVRFAAKLEYE